MSGAKILADTIAGILNHGAGPMDISFDSIRVELRAQRGYSLDEAKTFLNRHLQTALALLGEQAWSAVKTTAEWDRIAHVPPSDERALKRCIAGIGRGGQAVALHFTFTEDDYLFLWAREHGARVWRGKRDKETNRLKIEAEAGRLTPDGLARIADTTTDRHHAAQVRALKAALTP